jgi:quaternary ammonium compound-resistance protein SugE
MAWLYVVLAAVIDTGLFTLLKVFQAKREWIIVICLLAVAVPFVMSFAIKTLPMGTAYAVFVGLAMVGTATVGIVFFGESASAQRLLFLGLILAGVIGLRLLENPGTPAS